MPIPPALRNLVRTTPTLVPLTNRCILSVSGSQASDFLNGLLASHISPDRPCYTAFLHAQGRVIHDVFVYTQPAPAGKSTFLIEHDSSPSEAPDLFALLKRYVLRSKVRIRDVTEEYDVWAAWGSEAREDESREWSWAESGSVEPVVDLSKRDWPWGVEHGIIRDWRGAGMGRRMVVTKGEKPKEASTHDITSSDAYLLHRIMHGVPEGNTDIQPMHAFPMESNLDMMGGLDFRKGCYVGQELTVRTYHKGVVRKRILPVSISSKDASTSPPSLPAHLSISPTRINCDKPPLRGTGTLLSNVPAPAHGVTVGLALLRLQHVEGVTKGEVELAVKDTHAEGSEKAWQVRHWYPDWWPSFKSVHTI